MVIASLLLWLGNVACTIGIIVKVTTLHKHDALISTASLVPWITSYWAITITINIITTGGENIITSAIITILTQYTFQRSWLDDYGL